MADNALMLGYALAPSRRRYNLTKTFDLDDLIKNWRPDSRYDKDGITTPGLAESRLNGARASFD
jgi:hypothetical protein